MLELLDWEQDRPRRARPHVHMYLTLTEHLGRGLLAAERACMQTSGLDETDDDKLYHSARVVLSSRQIRGD